jgi:hypothetical protein
LTATCDVLRHTVGWKQPHDTPLDVLAQRRSTVRGDSGLNLSATGRTLRFMAIARFPSFVLDCDDPRRLADFYGALLEWKATSDEGWGEVRNPAGDQCICFQAVAQFRPPQWPGQDSPQQMHIDVIVDDLALEGCHGQPSLDGQAFGAGSHDGIACPVVDQIQWRDSSM